jgi:thioredoxin 1
MQHIESENELNDLIKNPGYTHVFVDFFATWCGPCKRIAPELEKLSKKYTSVKFVKVDVDDLPELAEKYEVSAMPTFLMFKHNDMKPFEPIVGADLTKIENLLKFVTTKVVVRSDF